MKRLLIVEGNSAAARDKAVARSVTLGSEIYRQAVATLAGQMSLDVVIDIACAADPGPPLPAGTALGDYAGVIIGGSSLHAYDKSPEVQRQIELLLAVAERGLPVFGSCWGLQIAAIAAGGAVARSDKGREVGMARKIVPNDAGRSHAMLAGRGDCYDALCIHYDEVSVVPRGCQVLAGNSHSAIQVAVVSLRRSQVWAVQYHPEFDLRQVAQLLRLYAEDMIRQGYFANTAQLEAHATLWNALHEDRSQAGLAWQLGIDSDTLDDDRRRIEICNWLRRYLT